MGFPTGPSVDHLILTMTIYPRILMGGQLPAGHGLVSGGFGACDPVAQGCPQTRPPLTPRNSPGREPTEMTTFTMTVTPALIPIPPQGRDENWKAETEHPFWHHLWIPRIRRRAGCRLFSPHQAVQSCEAPAKRSVDPFSRIPLTACEESQSAFIYYEPRPIKTLSEMYARHPTLLPH